MATIRKAARNAPDNFENALDELEQLVEKLESGELALDALMENYQRGAQLIKFCREKLKAVEQQVQVLENGELKPWAEESGGPSQNNQNNQNDLNT